MKLDIFKDGRTGCFCIECGRESPLARISLGDGKMAAYFCPGCRKLLMRLCETDSHERQQELRAGLKEIDGSDIDTTDWETNFLDSVLRGSGSYLSERQIEAAERMINKYRKHFR